MTARPTIYTQISTLQTLKRLDAIGAVHRAKKIRDTEAGLLNLSLTAAIESMEWLRDNRDECMAWIEAKRRQATGSDQ